MADMSEWEPGQTSMLTEAKCTENDTLTDTLMESNAHDTSTNITLRRPSRSSMPLYVASPLEEKLLTMLESINANLASQATSLKTLSEASQNTKQSLEYTQKDVEEVQNQNKRLMKENQDLTRRVLTLEKQERDMGRRVTDIDHTAFYPRQRKPAT